MMGCFRNIAWVLSSAMLLPVLLTSGCRTAEISGDRKESIRIGVILPLSGPDGAQGRRVLQGVNAGVALINAQGGVRERRIAVITADDQGRTEGAEKLFERMARHGGVSAVIGSYSSAVTLKLRLAARECRMPLLVPLGTNDEITRNNPYVFRICFNDRTQSKALAYHLRFDRMASRIGVLFNLDEKAVYSRDLGRQIAQNFVDYGGRVVRTVGFRESDEDFTAVLSQLIAAQPEVIVVPAYGRAAARIVKRARELGFDGAFAGGDGWDDPDFLKYAPDRIGSHVFSSMFTADGAPEELRNFVAYFTERTGRAPGDCEVQGYVAALMLGVVFNGGTDPDAVMRNLGKVRVANAPTGDLAFDAEGDGTPTVFLCTYRRDARGKWYKKLIKPLNPMILERKILR